MKHTSSPPRRRVLILVALVLVMPCAGAMAANNPVDENWWPSEFGPDDQYGAVNTITPEKRLEAVKLVKQGRTLTLGMPYQHGMPLVPGRTFTLLLAGAGRPLHGPLPWQGDRFKQTFNDEIVTAELGQVGSQFDGLGHPMIWVDGETGWPEGNYMYNRRRLEDGAHGYGLQVNGVEHVAEIGFFTRGVMIDVPALKGVGRLAMGEQITVDDFHAAIRRQGVDAVGQGDVVLIRTGWIQLWKSYLDEHGRIAAPADVVRAANEEFGSGEPGVSKELCDYLASRRIAMLVVDQGAVEPLGGAAAPPAEPFAYCHMNLLARRGIYLFENIDMEGLAQEQVYEFLFSWAPLKLVGATGSPGNPLVAW